MSEPNPITIPITVVDCPMFRAKLTLKACIERRTMARSQVKADPFNAAAREACANCELGRKRAKEVSLRFEEGPSYVWTPADRSAPEVAAAAKAASEKLKEQKTKP